MITLAIGLSTVGCGPSEQDEAISLVRRVDAIELDAPRAQRRERIETLKALPVSHESLRMLKEACASAHGDLLDAETQQDDAQQKLEVARRRYGHVGIPPIETQRIAAAVRGSEQDLAQAEALLPGCMRQVAALRLKYRVSP